MAEACGLAGGNITRRGSLVAGPRRYNTEVAKQEQLQALLLRAINCTRSDSTGRQTHVAGQTARASCL
jgi:hypothetical protein